ncbi:MAG: molybdenum cofactor biosysynthesis protein, partial [Methanomicrobiales archaeon]|nr:molybdenum cofactor biosysynthesis protein [Methanomicrobiales archaeon]
MKEELVIEWRHTGRSTGEVSEETGMTLAAVL